ncbi:MAG: TLD-domain-containing protein [Benjaminiella poitrasii]|nr:MAG: TLD-domain-containing protein [Benjaminiella poitrasii]
MKRLSTLSTSTSFHHHYHHHHHHHHHHGVNKERLSPIYRSVTEENQHGYTNDDSPITKFVCKLLGLSNTPSRHRLWHKSRSTTSITKSSVISAYQHTTLINTCISHAMTANKPSAITIVTPQSPCTSLMNWDQLELPPPSTKLKDNDTSSVSSSLTTSSDISTVNSLLFSTTNNSSLNHNDDNKCSPIVSPAVDALVTASLLPTRHVQSNEFDSMPSVKLTNRKHDTEPVMTEAIAELIRPYIPKRYRIAQKWGLIYSLDQHGISLSTLYTLMKRYDGPCIMILKDADKQIFGAYLSNSLALQNYYYGTGECFLWKLTTCHQQNKERETMPKIKVFPWTGKNDYMILSDSEFIAIGGGDGTFGLWLNSELEKGYSNTCPTYNNEILSIKPEFQCLELEAWGLYI